MLCVVNTGQLLRDLFLATGQTSSIATIATMEDVCPVAKKKSLKSCLVFTTHNMSHINYGNITSLTNLTAFINTEDVPSNTFNSNDEFEAVKDHNMLANVRNSLDNQINVEINEKDNLENLIFPSNEDIIDNLSAKTDENASVVLFERVVIAIVDMRHVMCGEY